MISEEFDQVIAAHKRPNPVAQERAALAPVRAAAVAGLAELETAIANAKRDFLDPAIAKYNAAHSVGMSSLELRHQLMEAMALIEGGPTRYRNAIASIDNLSKEWITNRWHLMVPGEVTRAGDAIGALRALETTIAFEVKRLEEHLKDTMPVVQSVPQAGG